MAEYHKETRNPTAQSAAESYRERGWSPIPLKIRSKVPKLPRDHEFLTRKATDGEYRGFDFRHNVGIVAGKVSGLIVLDDDDAGETLRANGWHVPATPAVKTKRGHQYFFTCPEGGFPTFDVAGKLEVRADGAYVVAPPSTHPSGERYEWVISPDEAELEDPPEWLMEQARLRGRRMRAEDVGKVIANGSRNKVLFSLACTLRRRGLDETGICAALLGINRAKCETPLSEKEVLKIAQSATRYEPSEASQPYNPSGARGPEDEDDEQSANRLLASRVDMGKAIAQGIDPPDELEPDVLLEGKIHHLFGPSESGKTILALWLIKRRVEARQYVIAFDAENGPRTIAERLKQMGADPELIGEYLVYLPFPDLTLGARRRQEFYGLLDEIKPVLIVFDSWASFLSAAGFSENENAEIEHWDNALTKRAKERGIASVILDHVPHDADRSRGGARKKEVADVQWRVKKTLDFDRDSVGEVLLIRTKDREGWLPPSVTFSVGGDFGRLVCTRSAGTIDDPRTSADGLTTKERTVLQTLIEEFPNGAKQAEWQRATNARDVARKTHYRAVRKLVSKEVSKHLQVSRINDTYFPPDDPEPPKTDDTSITRVDKPETERCHEVSNRCHDTNDTSTDGVSVIRVPPLKGGTDDTASGTTPDQQQRIRKLVEEGWSEHGARMEVLAKDHPLSCECEVCG